MRSRALPAVALAALLATAGCAAVGIGDDGPAPRDFPNGSEIDAATYDRHATTLSNTSFTATFRMNLSMYDAHGDPLFESGSVYGGTREFRVDPAKRQYRMHSSGRWPFPGQVNNATVFANDLLQWTRYDDRDGSVTDDSVGFRFDPSSDLYLWGGWHDRYYETPRLLPRSDIAQVAFVSADVSYERLGIEQFRGTSVMRYEASGVDALDAAPHFDGAANASVTEFSATLLLDADGVIRRFDVAYAYEVDGNELTYEFSHTVTDVGGTAVERPPWVGPTVAA